MTFTSLTNGVKEAFTEQFFGNITSGSWLSKHIIKHHKKHEQYVQELLAKSYNPASFMNSSDISKRIESLQRQKQEFQFDLILKNRQKKQVNPVINYFKNYFQTTRVQPFGYYSTYKYIKNNIPSIIQQILCNESLDLSCMADSLQVQVLQNINNAIQNNKRIYLRIDEVSDVQIKQIQKDTVSVYGYVRGIYIEHDGFTDQLFGSPKERNYRFDLDMTSDNKILKFSFNIDK